MQLAYELVYIGFQRVYLIKLHLIRDMKSREYLEIRELINFYCKLTYAALQNTLLVKLYSHRV